MWRTITIRRRPDGSVGIDGQDLSAGGEYEWAWSIAPAEVDAAVAAIGGQPGDDLVELLERWSKANDDRDPGVVLKDAGVEMEFWSRFGD